MVARTAEAIDVPEVPWDQFLPDFMRAWKANAGGRAEHVSIVGPTGEGKTTLALAILAERARLRGSSIVALSTKKQDHTFAKLGWPTVKEWPPGYGQDQVVFKPPFGDVRGVVKRQREAFEPMLAQVFADGNRVVYIDETAYFTDQLKLDTLLKHFWQQGRSQNIILVAGTQRPVEVPRQMWSECSWLLAFRTSDEDELRRVASIGGGDTQAIRATLRELEPHEFLAVQKRARVMVRSKVQR